jgi:hypothetical protein
MWTSPGCGILAAVAQTRRLAVAVVVLLTGAFAACGGPVPGQAAAHEACRAYADTGRHQVATSATGAEALRTQALSAAQRAASTDSRWQPLQRDIEEVFTRPRNFATATEADMDAYFAADRRVQADCQASGQDIGDLLP